MRRPRSIFVALLAVATALAEDDLPKRGATDLLDVEPTLMPNRAELPEPATDHSVARLEVEVERARNNAAAGERLFRSGILSKVEAETRVLKLVRLTADLAATRLAAAETEATEMRAKSAAQHVSKDALEATETALVSATADARKTAAARDTAEIKAAELNVSRRRQLLASGIGRKSDVQRAEDQLAALRETIARRSAEK